MAAVVRQPFAPLDGTRLQKLTSAKNRQNALPISPNKRKACALDVFSLDDAENIDPSFSSKRSKVSSYLPGNDFVKPSPTAFRFARTDTGKAVQPAPRASTRPRMMLEPKSPLAKTSLSTGVLSSASRPAPAGRSPTRGNKRFGIRSYGPTRMDPPVFGGLAAAAPFSLDAALKGTIPGYGRTPTTLAAKASVLGHVHDMAVETKPSWFFDIHEDTPEQEMNTLLQHGTCILDISSDEENETRARRDRAEGRDKENVPPADDVSQTSVRRRVVDEDCMVFEKARGPLMEMNAADYYAEGCDESTVVVVPDEGREETAVKVEETAKVVNKQASSNLALPSIDEIMGTKEACAKAAVLEPIEGTGESFVLWESASAKDEGSAPASPASL